MRPSCCSRSTGYRGRQPRRLQLDGLLPGPGPDPSDRGGHRDRHSDLPRRRHPAADRLGLRGLPGVAAQALGALVLRAYYLGQLFPGFGFLRHAARILPTCRRRRWCSCPLARARGRTVPRALAELAAYGLITPSPPGSRSAACSVRLSDTSSGARWPRRACRLARWVLCIGNRYPPWSLGGYETVGRGGGGAARARPRDPRPHHPPRSDRPGQQRSGARRCPPRPGWYCASTSSHGAPHCAPAWPGRANAETFAAHRDTSARRGDVVGDGRMSLSLLEQARRAGVPALAVVGDEWVNYGPEVDGWSRRWCGAGRWLARGPSSLAGIPARLGLELAGQWLCNSSAFDALDRPPGRLAASGRHRRSPGRCRRSFAGVPAAGDWQWRLLCCGRIDPARGSRPQCGHWRCFPRRHG